VRASSSQAALSRAKAEQAAKEAAHCAVCFDVALTAFTLATFDGAHRETFVAALAAGLGGVAPGQVFPPPMGGGGPCDTIYAPR
jgi:hypothetical protein